MAKIVYGVSGEGSGHSSRARLMVSYLETLGHQTIIATYDRGYDNLKEDFEVFKIEGLHIASINNRVSKVKTFTGNFNRLGKGHQKFQALRHKLFKEFMPDCVITDFEPMTAYLANHYHMPLITIDNQHRLRYMHYDCPENLKKDKIMTQNIIRAMVPKPDISLVTTFYFGESKNERTFLFPPILRNEVLSLKPETKDYIIVYLTSGFEAFIEYLKKFQNERFIIYGYHMSKKDGHITFKPHSKDGFLKDLASCKAVMATAGFTLITESLHLKKPYLALPMIGQFEQEINAIFLSKLKYGINLRNVSPEAIGDFLYRLPELKTGLKNYKSSDNSEICSKLKEILSDNCAMAKEYHKNRNR